MKKKIRNKTSIFYNKKFLFNTDFNLTNIKIDTWIAKNIKFLYLIKKNANN